MKTQLLREKDYSNSSRCSNSSKETSLAHDTSDIPIWNDKTVLIVDDQIDMLVTIKSMLETFGYSVNAFNDPLLAVEHFTQHSHDYGIVISDMTMPSMSGLEFIKQVKSMNPDIASFILTALDSSWIKDNQKEMLYESTLIELDGIIQKPILLNDLCRLVEKSKN